MSERAVLREVRSDGVTILTLNRPAARNALDRAVIDTLVDDLDDFGRDDQQRVLMLTGRGTSFCAGGDLSEIAAMADAPSDRQRNYLFDHIQRIPRAFARIDKPVIAAVNGPAYGAGMDIALMCDLRIGGRSARLASSYINLGLVAGDGGGFFLSRLIGVQRTLDLLWTGRVMSADEASSIGLFLSVVDDEALQPSALAIAVRIAAQPPEAIRMMKRAVHDASTTNLQAHLDLMASHMAVLYDSTTFRDRIGKIGDRR